MWQLSKGRRETRTHMVGRVIFLGRVCGLHSQNKWCPFRAEPHSPPVVQDVGHQDQEEGLLQLLPQEAVKYQQWGVL